MARSTYRQLTNYCLAINGQLEITSDASFDADDMGKPQYLIKKFVDLSYRTLALEYNRRFGERTFQISTNTTDTEFQLDLTASIEGLRPNSFFNITASNRAAQGRLSVMDYQRWRTNWPDPSTEPRNMPLYFIAPGDDGEKPDSIILWPYPDATYTIEYQSRLEFAPLTTANQVIIFPTAYEHLLVAKASELFKSGTLGGDGALWSRLAWEIAGSVLSDTLAPKEQVIFADLGMTLGGHGTNWGPMRDWVADDEVL